MESVEQDQIVHNYVHADLALFPLQNNPFPDDKNLTLSKLKAFADNEINVTLMIKSVFDRVKNIVGKAENAGYQYFLLFKQFFSLIV